MMSRYTTQVRWIVEESTWEFANLPMSQRISLSCSKIFNFNYPIWNSDYKPLLEKKILMHYFNKEIGFETVGLWKLYLEERLNMIMPYYNSLYETTINDYNYLWDTDYTESFLSDKTLEELVKYTNLNTILNKTTGETNDEFNGNSVNDDNEIFNGKGKNNQLSTNQINKNDLKSDFPQANYASMDYGSDMLESNQNETNQLESSTENDSSSTKKGSIISKNTNVNNTKQETDSKISSNSGNDLKSTTIDKYTRKNTGARGGKSLTELMMLYRESLLNIDKLIIEELADLFMMLY